MADSVAWVDFCGLIQAGMRRKGISLRELCRRCGIDASFMSKVFAGKRNPPAHDEILLSLASALEIKPSEMFISVGRIPGEWSRIRTDRHLFDEISGIIEETSPRAAEARQSPGLSQEERAAFPDELL